MDLFEAIYLRQSIGKVKPDPVPRELIEKMLAAQALGLATYWRTGRAATDPDVKAFLGFEPDQHVIGFIYVGYPLAEPGRVERLGPEDRTVWMD